MFRPSTERPIYIVTEMAQPELEMELRNGFFSEQIIYFKLYYTSLRIEQ